MSGLREVEGTNGVGAGVENELGLEGVAWAVEAAGLNGGIGGGGVNSGNADAGDGGVAVAAAPGRSGASSRGRGAPGVADEGAGPGDAAGRRGGVEDSPRSAGCANPPVSHPLWVARGGWLVGAVDSAEGRNVLVPEEGVVWPVGAGIEITPLHTEQRARTPAGGTLAGSTRKIDRQSGQLTFIQLLRSFVRRELPAPAPAE